MTKKSKLFLLCFNLSLVILLLNPQINFYYQKASDLFLISSNVLKDSIIILIPVFLLFFITFFLIDLVLPKNVVVKILIVITIYSFLCTINPVINAGVTDMKGFTNEIAFNKFAINACASIAIYYYFLRDIRLDHYNLVFSGILILILLIFLYLNNSHKLPSSKIDKITLGQKNIIVFSFDGIPGHIINQLLESSSSYRTDFKDFTLYKSTVSHSPATFASLFSEIFGSQNWKQIATTEKELKFYGDEWLKLEQFNYLDESYLYGKYSVFSDSNNSENLISGANQILDSDQPYAFFSTIFFISSSMCRTGFCSLGEKYGRLDKYILKTLNLFKIQMDVGGSQIAEYKAFQNILNKIHRGKNDYGSFFGHFTFSHFPILHDENCEFNRFHSFPEIEKSIINQTECIISSMKDVVNILKEENIYDKSFIVFKSDHGKPRIYYKKNTLRGKFLFNNNLWGYDRYRPFLMIKKPEEKKENLEAVNDMFYLSDLSNLYCKYGLLKSKVQNDACDELSNLLYKNFKLDNKNKKYIFVPKSSNDFKFDGQDAFENPDTLFEMEEMFKEWVTN